MTTDPARIRKTDPGHPEVCIVHRFQKVFNEEEVENITAQCRAGEIGCMQCKRCLANKMNELLAHIHARRKELEAKPGYIKEVLEYGNQRAKAVARANMEEIRRAMNVL